MGTYCHRQQRDGVQNSPRYSTLRDANEASVDEFLQDLNRCEQGEVTDHISNLNLAPPWDEDWGKGLVDLMLKGIRKTLTRLVSTRQNLSSLVTRISHVVKISSRITTGLDCIVRVLEYFGIDVIELDCITQILDCVGSVLWGIDACLDIIKLVLYCIKIVHERMQRDL